MNGRLTPLSFHVNRPSHSWDKAISNFELETSRSRSWVWSKRKVIQSAQYLTNSLPIYFKSIRRTIPEIQLQWHPSGKARNASLKLQNLVHFHAPVFTNHVYFTPHDKPPPLKGHHLRWPNKRGSTVFRNFTLKNPRSRSCVRSQVKVT